MSGDAWKQLVLRYADGRPPCNCGDAYYAMDGVAWQGNRKITNNPHCKDGCSANQFNARNEIARRVLAELSPNSALPNQPED